MLGPVGSGAELPVLLVDLGDGVRAGFTTRAGGVSEPPWDELDLGLGTGDAPEHVRANRALVDRWVGGRVAFSTQVHGADVLTLVGSSTVASATVGEADGLVSTSPDVAVGVLVADCVPVLLADAESRVVAAVHAGRRGLVAGVVQAAVDSLVRSGAQRSRLRAVVGPAISGAAYEVPAAMRDEVASVIPETWATTTWGTPALDLPAGVDAVLRRSGVGRVERVGVCTWTDERFYSHRRAQRSGTTTGRFAGVVRLTG